MACGLHNAAADKRNLEKYQGLAEAYRAKYGHCELATVIIPSVGAVPALSLDAVRRVLPPRRAVSTLRDMAVAVARANVKFCATLPPSPRAVPSA